MGHKPHLNQWSPSIFNQTQRSVKITYVAVSQNPIPPVNIHQSNPLKQVLHFGGEFTHPKMGSHGFWPTAKPKKPSHVQPTRPANVGSRQIPSAPPPAPAPAAPAAPAAPLAPAPTAPAWPRSWPWIWPTQIPPTPHPKARNAKRKKRQTKTGLPVF